MAYTLSTSLGLTYDEVYNKLTNSPESWEYVVIQDYVGCGYSGISYKKLVEQLEDADDPRLKGLAFKPHFAAQLS